MSGLCLGGTSTKQPMCFISLTYDVMDWSVINVLCHILVMPRIGAHLCDVSFPWRVMECSVIYILCHWLVVSWIGHWSALCASFLECHGMFSYLFFVTSLGCHGLLCDLYFVTFPWGVMECSVIFVLWHFLGMSWNVQLSMFWGISLGCHGMFSDLRFMTFPWDVIECIVFCVLWHFSGLS